MNARHERRHCTGMLTARVVTVFAALFTTVAVAEPALRREVDQSPFERTFGLGAYATGWAGAYGGAGVGARIRVEPLSWLGVDLFGEALMVTNPAGIRHDHPIGFNLYVPVRLGKVVRVRPLLGMCVVASLIEPLEAEAPRADDILVGAHVGAALDLALHKRSRSSSRPRGWCGWGMTARSTGGRAWSTTR